MTVSILWDGGSGGNSVRVFSFPGCTVSRWTGSTGLVPLDSVPSSRTVDLTCYGVQWFKRTAGADIHLLFL